MKVVLCREFGHFDNLVIADAPDPQPGPGEVCVAPAAWGVNYVDLIMIAGTYQLRPELPFIPGGEAAGTVLAVGPGVQDIAIGARVMTSHRPGAFAETVIAPRRNVFPIPDGMPFEEAAGFRAAFATAYHALVQGGRLATGEVALVHGAGGGMGLAAVQVAKQLGATVIATAGSDAKRKVATRLGADKAIDYAGGFRDRVKALTDGRGVDVVFDPIGGDVFDESMRCIDYGARLVVVGFVGGRAAQARTNHLLIKCATVTGIRAGANARRNPHIAQANLDVLLRWAAEGRIRTHISHRFPFDRVSDALRAIANREVIGKAVLTRPR